MTDKVRQIIRDLVVTFIGVVLALFVVIIVMTLYTDHAKTTQMWEAMNRPAPGPLMIPHK